MEIESILEVVEYDLVSLRERLAPLFLMYDHAVARRDQRPAWLAKIEITRTAIGELRGTLSETARGLYFFVGKSNTLECLTYIGIASPDTLLNRQTGRFRDETCLDKRQYGRPREDVWDTAYRRMCVSMGAKSTTETLIRYAYDHVKTTALFQSADRLMFFVTDAPRQAIKAAESLLIYSAVSAGAPLVNIQERDKLATDFGPGEELALEIINRAGIGAAHWSARAEILLSRFRGECC